MEQFLEVIERDELTRFESASAFIGGKPGIDALTLSATLELSWSDAASTVALIVGELGKREMAEAKRLHDLKDSGRPFSDENQKMLERAETDAAFNEKAREALDLLGDDHLKTALTPVNEALRQFPKDPRTYRVAAFYYLLSGHWEDFDTAMGWLKETEAEDPGIQYLKAMEALKRFGIKKETRAFLTEALKLNPKLVRAQAKLLLVTEGIGPKHDELEKLRALAPDHPVVSLAGPAITSEWQISGAVQEAKGNEPTSPTEPAPPPPAATSPVSPAQPPR
jgi:hypothetical protein